MGGKTTTVETEIKSGKNIGKSNETSKLQQAQITMNSLYNKQKDAGYVDDIEALKDQLVVLPMLADKWETKNHKISETFFVQPKLDGVRMLVGKYNGEVVMLSRTGKYVKHLEHIRDEVKDLLNEGDFLDGENYNDDIPFEEITGMCRTTLETSASNKNLTMIQFHVFDIFNIHDRKVSFEKRFKLLKKLFEKSSFKFLKLVKTFQSDRNSLTKYHKSFTESGYEGTMIRDPSGVYSLSERSHHLLKMKDFHTDEYLIVGAEEATGRDKGTVIWICKMNDGKTFNVRPRGSQAERKKLFKDSQNIIKSKKFLTVQYQNLTEGGIPRFPVGLSIRDYE